MSDEIIKVLDHISNKFGIAIDWSSANVAPYLQDLMARMVKYVTYTNIIWIIVSILIIILSLFIIYKSWNAEMTDMDTVLFTNVVFIIIVIILLIRIVCSINNIVEVNTIPEKYLIEMVQIYM